MRWASPQVTHLPVDGTGVLHQSASRTHAQPLPAPTAPRTRSRRSLSAGADSPSAAAAVQPADSQLLNNAIQPAESAPPQPSPTASPARRNTRAHATRASTVSQGPPSGIQPSAATTHTRQAAAIDSPECTSPQGDESAVLPARKKRGRPSKARTVPGKGRSTAQADAPQPDAAPNADSVQPNSAPDAESAQPDGTAAQVRTKRGRLSRGPRK